VKDKLKVSAVTAPSAQEVMGVNDRAQLAEQERFYQRRKREADAEGCTWPIQRDSICAEHSSMGAIAASTSRGGRRRCRLGDNVNMGRT